MKIYSSMGTLLYKLPGRALNRIVSESEVLAIYLRKAGPLVWISDYSRMAILGSSRLMWKQPCKPFRYHVCDFLHGYLCHRRTACNCISLTQRIIPKTSKEREEKTFFVLFGDCERWHCLSINGDSMRKLQFIIYWKSVGRAAAAYRWAQEMILVLSLFDGRTLSIS